MKLSKLIRKQFRHSGDGTNVVADVNAVVAANVGGKGETNRVSSHSSSRVVQRSGHSETADETVTSNEAEGGAK